MEKKSRSQGNAAVKDLTPRKTEDVKGGRDAATGLSTGKRSHGYIG